MRHRQGIITRFEARFSPFGERSAKLIAMLFTMRCLKYNQVHATAEIAIKEPLKMPRSRLTTILTFSSALLVVGLAMPAFGQSSGAKSYYVDGAAPGAADSNPGTEAAPWKTLHRATTAKELQAGDTVYIKSIFRDLMTVKVNGEVGKPLWYEWKQAQPYLPSPPKRIETVDVMPDVAYGYKDGMAMTFDILKPKKGVNGAGILVVMSGAWYSGHYPVEQMADSWKYSLDRGFTIFIVYHPSASKYLLPEIVDSMHRSVRFIRANAKRFGVDPDRLGRGRQFRRAPDADAGHHRRRRQPQER